jgi:DNA polymerase-3 subunit gamma/tau
MSYIALYRKYRSQSFDELMGQEQVTVTLQNAIRSGRIAHAYLFYGARGCGKTSTARLLARALNCVAQDGPTPTPCGECRLCVGIRDGICMDVIEMDAASETGIDDVREKIVENVQYAPGEARYKVYIIDEVHDLSAKAFDALLKTLEEPPPHVIFILATTEQHKVPITIRSRCMPYHFKRGTLLDLAKAVQRVIDAEGCTAEPEAVQAIARGAEGSWRDALSLLEQVLAYADGHVTADIVHRAIGSVGTETLARVTETLAQGDWCATLAIAGELIDSGKDVRQLLTTLSGHLRDLMLISAGAHNAALQELGPERYALLKSQAPLFDPPTLLAMSSILATAEREIRFTNQHRWLLESTLLRLMPANLAAAPAPQRAAAAAPPVVQPRRETVASTPTVVPRPHAGAPSEYTPPPRDEVTPDPTPPTITPPAEAVQISAPAVSSAPTDAAGHVPSKETPVVTQPENSRFAADISLEVVVRAWPRVLALFKKASPSGAPWLEKGEAVGLEGHTIVLAFADSFARERIQNNSKGKAKVEQVLNQALNTDGFKIRCIPRDPEQALSPQSVLPAQADPPSDSGMAALLDAPETTTATAGPARIADFELSTLPLRDERSTAAAIIQHGDGTTTPVTNGNLADPAQGGLLAEALSVFGGTVIRSEPIDP